MLCMRMCVLCCVCIVLCYVVKKVFCERKRKAFLRGRRSYEDGKKTFFEFLFFISSKSSTASANKPN